MSLSGGTVRIFGYRFFLVSRPPESTALATPDPERHQAMPEAGQVLGISPLETTQTTTCNGMYLFGNIPGLAGTWE